MNRQLPLSPTTIGLLGVCLLGLLGTITYIVSAVLHMEQESQTRLYQQITEGSFSGTDTRAFYQGAGLLFRSTALGETYGRLAQVSFNPPDVDPFVTALHCDRLHFAAGHGVCLTANRGVFTTYEAIIFNGHLQPRFKIALGGIPSRARVSPDGRMAAISVFVNGHSYADGTFSTLTTVVDLHSGKLVVSDLEKFAVWHDGVRLQSIDLNFWGVTFSRDNNRFYATLWTGGRTYLVEGNLAGEEVRILRDNLECPSLSPDNTRIAFKKRVNNVLGPAVWRLHVLDLRTYEEWPLTETRNVDDQVEWLDDHRVLYALPDRESATARSSTWVVPADGSGDPRLFLPGSYSTVVVRSWLPQVSTH